MDEESQLIELTIDERLKKLEERMDTTFTFNIRYMKFIISMVIYIFVLFNYKSQFFSIFSTTFTILTNIIFLSFNSKMFLLKFTYFLKTYRKFSFLFLCCVSLIISIDFFL